MCTRRVFRRCSVIVSQWTAMLDVVRRHLTAAGVRCAVIKGDVSAKNRADIVDAFNTDANGPEVSETPPLSEALNSIACLDMRL